MRTKYLQRSQPAVGPYLTLSLVTFRPFFQVIIIQGYMILYIFNILYYIIYNNDALFRHLHYFLCNIPRFHCNLIFDISPASIPPHHHSFLVRLNFVICYCYKKNYKNALRNRYSFNIYFSMKTRLFLRNF